MATKKVEEESVKNKKATKKAVDKDKKKTTTKTKAATKKSDVKKEVKKETKKEIKKETKTVTKEKKANKKEVEEKIVCEECGKKFLASLEKCPSCGYSIHEKKNSFYDDDEDAEYDDEDEDYDDEDAFEEREVVVKEKKSKEEKKKDSKKKVKEEKVKTEKEPKKEKTKKLNFKKEKKQKYVSGKSSIVEQNEDFFNLIKILVGIVLIVGVVYLVVAILNGEFKKEEESADDEVVETIQNDKILASSIFDKADDEYYVLIYDSSNVWADYYSMVYEEYSYIENEDVLPLFWVDLSNKFNEDIIASGDEETNSDAQEYSELSVMSPTLIHIEDGENVDYYEGDEVVETLSDIINSFKEEE